MDSLPLATEHVRNVFLKLESGDPESFFENVADDVDWTVLGTHPLAGRYRSKEGFLRNTFARIGRALREPPRLTVRNVLVDGSCAAVELRMERVARTGMEFNNDYCWIVRFCDGKIVEARAYLDSALVQRLVDENHV
jgi:ketosteroid isomerase-like protein